jgi:hypothetical protein
LRATPGGFGTPAFGDEIEVIRISGRLLIHESGGQVNILDLEGTTLRRRAEAVGTDLSAPFE